MNNRNKVAEGFSGPAIRGAVCSLALVCCQSAAVFAQDSSDHSRSLLDNSAASQEAIISTCLTGDNGNSSDAANQRFQDDCNTLAGGLFSDDSSDVADAENAFDALAADQVSAQNAVAVRRNDANLSVVAQRLQLLRVASGYSAYDSEQQVAGNVMFNGATGGGASADGDSRLGVFLNGRYLTGDEDANALQDGYDFDGYGVLLGMDYRLSDNFVGGLAVNYSDAEADYDKDRGDLDAETLGVMAYGSVYMESGLYFEGTVGYNEIEYDMTRQIDYAVQGNVATQEMSSSPDGSAFSASLGGGYSFGSGSWSFTPTLRVDYLENDIDSYQEKSSDLAATGGAMALAMNSTSFESLKSNLGIQISNAISTGSGVIVPQFSVDWVREYEDDPTAIRARFVNDINNPTNTFVVGTSALDDEYYDLALGVSAQFQGGVSGFVNYRTLLDYDGLSYNSIEAGIRMEL